jgi:signal transduction histidine kinase
VVSQRAAKLLSRGLLGLAVVLAIATFVASTAAARHPVTAPIVVGDPSVADGPQVLVHIQRQIANGGVHLATGVNGRTALGFILALLWLWTGSLIVSRQPRNLAGWLFIAVGVAWVVQALGVSLVAWSLMTGGHLPLRGLFAVIGENSFAPFQLLPLLFLLFPDGKPPSPGWRWAIWVLLAGVLVGAGYSLNPGPLNNFVDSGILYVNPIGVRPLGGLASALTLVGVLSVLSASLATVPAVRGRYKRSTGEERQQLRWLVAVATLAGALLALLLLLISVPVADESRIVERLSMALFVSMLLTVAIGIPAAYLVAILRFGLWDLDVVIKRAAVALTIAGLLSGIGFLLFAWVGQLTLWDLNPWVRAGIGIGIGVLLVPLLRLSRRIANRIVYGRRATPYEVLATFSSRVGETYSTDDVLPRMAEVLRTATGAEGAAVWLRLGGELREEAASPSADGRRVLPMNGDALPDLVGENAMEVRHHGELLGALSVRMRASDPMNPAKDRLMRDLASQAGLVLRNVRLLEDLRESRRRIVIAQDERARKLERDLHDGAQQQLVALSIQLKLARSLIERDPAKAGGMLDTIQGSAAEALQDLRDLARGIYPPLLADNGLAAALEGQARKAAVRTTVEADAVGRFSRDVESAVYFCCLEALNNVAKYANASSTRVRLEVVGGRLTFEVTDDGSGFDPKSTNYGSGLQGMADRLDAIGGGLEVKSSPGLGTTVTGRVPTAMA